MDILSDISSFEITYDFYIYEQNRLNSFGPWFNSDVEKEKLARAGFFYLSERDYVKCFSCEVSVGYWVRGDNPFVEHKIHSPDCLFINDQPTSNIPIEETKHLLLEDLALLNKSDISSLSTSNRNTKLVKLTAEEIAEKARHPDYADKNERLKSFSNWPTSLKQTPEELSEAGFFYLGIGDEVKCFYCGGCLRNFESNDHALNEHKKHYSTRCLFIQYTYKFLKSNSLKLENKRPIKATQEQIQYLTDFMEQNESMRSGSLLQDRVSYVKTWKDLSNTLNDMGGATKDVKGWKEVWRNYKYNQKRKSKTEEMVVANTSSNDPIKYVQLSDIVNNKNPLEHASSNLQPIEITDLINFEIPQQTENLSARSADFSPIINYEDPNSNQNHENSNNLDPLARQIMQIEMKIEEQYLEIEKLKLELDMKIRQQQLAQKQKELQNKYREIESNKFSN